MRKRILLIAAFVCVPVLIGGTVVLAGRAGPSRDSNRRLSPDGGPPASRATALAATGLTGQASGGGCRLGLDTDENIVVAVPAGSTVSRARISKPCPGVVVGQFTTETGLTQEPTGTGMLFFRAEARCMQTGGFSNPCTVGEIVNASPGEVLLDGDVQPHVETRAMNAVWPNLPRGVWLFYVVISGENARVGRRTFHVEAFEGGPVIPPS